MAETWAIWKDLLAAADAGGLDSAACTLTMTPGRKWIRLSHMGSRGFAELRRVSDGRWAFCEGSGRAVQPLRRPLTALVASEDEVLALVTMWASRMSGRSLGNVREYRKLDNAPFSLAEQREIAANLSEIAGQVRNRADLSDRQIARIEEKLDELGRASKRVGRKDWLIMLYSAGFGLIANDLIPPHVVRSIFMTVITGLGHLFGIGGPPPMVST